jgi:hypothetical protein
MYKNAEYDGVMLPAFWPPHHLSTECHSNSKKRPSADLYLRIHGTRTETKNQSLGRAIGSKLFPPLHYLGTHLDQPGLRIAFGESTDGFDGFVDVLLG